MNIRGCGARAAGCKPLLQCVIAAAAWMPLASPTVAGSVGFSNLVPGGGILYRDVVSIRERRFHELVRQQTDYSCGAAALATILRFGFNQDVSEADVLQGMLQVSDAELVRQRGFSLLDMTNYLPRLGLAGRGFQVHPQQIERVRIPTIVLLNTNGYNHFVVLKKVVDGKAYIADPALGNHSMPKEAFLSGWNGILYAVLGQDFEADTELTDPQKAASAAQLMVTIAPELGVGVLDYGLIPATLMRF